MRTNRLTSLGDTWLSKLETAVARQRRNATLLLAYLAEFEARKLYLPAGYSSMFAFCVGELHLSEDATATRLQVARLATRFPTILDALAEGRLHLDAVVLLAPHLDEHTVDELLAAATHKSGDEILRLLAERFPGPDGAR